MEISQSFFEVQKYFNKKLEPILGSSYVVTVGRRAICWSTYFAVIYSNNNKKRTPWPESASKVYGPSDRRLSAKLVPTFADFQTHYFSENLVALGVEPGSLDLLFVN
jgi:hypothetical protein